MTANGITLERQYTDRCVKRFEHGDVTSIFPSINFEVKSRLDIDAIASNSNIYLSGITLPISKAPNCIRAIERLPTDRKEAFYSNTPIIADFESEFWYITAKETMSRKKAFTSIKEMPNAAQNLFRINKGKYNHVSFTNKKKDYLERLNNTFGREETLTGIVGASMQHATSEMSASIPLPPAPLIVGDDASKFFCLEVNRKHIELSKFFGLLKVAYYPLNTTAIGDNRIFRSILDQIYGLEPDIVIIGTLKSHEFLFPNHKFDLRKPKFKEFVKEIAVYAKSHTALVGWYDKGDFSSSYGMLLIKEGFDFFITPLNNRLLTGGGSGENKGPQYAHILNEYVYLSWDRYKKEALNHINTKNLAELNSIPAAEQWKYKRLVEIKTRLEQFKEIHENLEKVGSLEGYEVRLNLNKVE